MEIIYTLLILVGACAIAYSSILSIGIRKIASAKLRKRWRFLEILMWMFVAGYVFYISTFFAKPIIPYDLLSTVIFFGGAWFVYVVIRLSQVTLKDLKKFNEELVTTNEELENEIARRNRLEEQLLHSQKMKAIGQLAGGIAHDINNFLMPVIGYSEMLQEELEGKQREFLDQIILSSQKAAALTSNLLAFSRKQVLQTKELDINNVVRNIEPLVKRLVTENITIKLDLGGTPLPVRADKGQIEQIFMNLASNARDAMPSGGMISISSSPVHLDREFIEAHGFSRPGDYALITVCDNGLGMDRELMGKIFEPFFTTKDVDKGTGLGLSVVYGIIKQHDGEIAVYSEPGEGTTFRIYLPLVSEGRGEEEAPTDAPPARGSETILIAEDDIEVQNLLQTVLETYGYRTILARNGEEAITLFGQQRDDIHLVLLDVIMPGMNGMETFRRVRAMRPDIKCLLISGYSAEVLGEKGALEEGLDFISKPVAPRELLTKLRKTLDS